jgi:hypothetical protein
MHAHAPPIKKRAPLQEGRRGKLSEARGYSTCPHSATFSEQMPTGCVHHAEERCANCGRHLRWVPKPETIQRRRLIAFKLARLSMVEGLSDFERGFVRDVSRQRKFSPKQEAFVERLYAQYRDKRVKRPNE